MIEYNYEMEQADQKIEMLARLRLDLIKTIFETEGLDLGNSENNINYRNYLVDSQLMLGFGGFGGESYGLMNLAPSEYDKYIDYNSDDPFANLPGPPEGSGRAGGEPLTRGQGEGQKGHFSGIDKEKSPPHAWRLRGLL
jgi:hypothetical protein